MKADLTRYTFDAKRHYSRVIQQQGRVPIDADWNEQAEIQEHHDQTETVDVIGPAGFPQGTSFQLSASPDKTDVLIGDGTGYVNGILAENVNTAVEVLAFPAANKLTLRTLVLDDVALRVGEWLYITDSSTPGYTPTWLRIAAVDPPTQTVTLTANVTSSGHAYVQRVPSYTIQPDWYAPDLVTSTPPAMPALDQNGLFVAYLDVWRRHVTAIEDPELREVALGGPDTCTRAKTVWQVRLAAIAQGQPTDCTTPLPAEKSTGRLGARARQPSTGDTPCVITPTALYRSLENQLYRVEIHDPGPVDTATFKFSRDNGMVLTSWLASSGADLTVSSLGKDKVLGFAAGQWIELLDDGVEESQGPGTLARIKSVDPSTNTITIDTTTVYPTPSPTTRGYDIKNYPLSPRIRRWDHVSPTPAMSVTQPSGDGFIDLEQGVQVRFEAGYYASGDYWLIPARTITADVEWPRNESGTPLPRPRHGIKHQYARLGIVTVTGGQITGVADCRAQFPPLTGLPSSGAGCCCGVMIGPNDDPQTVIDGAIAKAGSGKIDGLTVEFAAGTFNLNMPIRIAAPQAGVGNLVVKGCGSSTRLVAAAQENVLRIVGWESATVTDLYAETGITATGAGAKGRPDQEPPPAPPNADFNRHLLGAVYMRNCLSSRVERVELKCASGPRREASCLAVWNDPGSPGASWVKDCRLHVGDLQVGILLVNQNRATVADNFIDTYTLASDAVVKLTTSPAYLGLLRRLVMRDVMIAAPGIDHATLDGFTNLSFGVGSVRVLFRADSALGKAWDNALKTTAPKAFHFLAAAKPIVATTAKPATEAKKVVEAKPAPAAGTPAPATPAAAAPPVVKSVAAALQKQVPVQATLVTPKGTSRAVQKEALKVRTRLNKMAYAVLNAAVNPNAKTTLTAAQLKPFKDYIAAFQANFTTTASAGIVIAGQLGNDLRVTDNTITGVLDGIHLGFSHAVVAGATPDVATRIQVTGNSIAVRLTPEIARGLHRAIFVGNGRSIVVQRNYITVGNTGKNQVATDGVSIWGKEGTFVVVSENDIAGATIGIRMWLDPLQTVTKHQWLAINNATIGCTTGLSLSAQVVSSGNLP